MSGASVGSTRHATHASAHPTIPASATTSRVSTSSCRASEARVAPMARRMTNSRRRSSPRTTSRFPRLSTATRKTSSAAAPSTQMAGRTCPTTTSASGRTVMARRESVLHWLPSISVTRRSSSRRASSAERPGRSLPTRSIVPDAPSSSSVGLIAAKVTQASDPRGRSKSPGATPTMVKVPLVTSKGFPRTAESRPKRRCHSPSLMTVTGAAPTRSSSAASKRPRSGTTPSVGKSSPLTTPIR